MNKNKASGVSWVKPSEPSFLKKFKSDANYKEGPTVDTKVKPGALTVWLGLASTSCMLTTEPVSFTHSAVSNCIRFTNDAS